MVNFGGRNSISVAFLLV